MSDHSPRSLRAQTALGALASLVLVLAGCSSNASPSQAAGGQSQAGGTTVTLSGLAFSVTEITIPVGSLTFVNQDTVTHLIAEGENGVEAASPRVQKVSVDGGSQGDLVFTVAGDYHITCLVHHQMNMEVHVQ